MLGEFYKKIFFSKWRTPSFFPHVELLTTQFFLKEFKGFFFLFPVSNDRHAVVKFIRAEKGIRVVFCLSFFFFFSKVELKFFFLFQGEFKTLLFSSVSSDNLNSQIY